MSHIVPKFVGRQLKTLSAIGYFRSGMQPDKRMQDLEKVPLLCKQCEGLLAKNGETPFSKKVFAPLWNDQDFQSFEYDEWLRYFAVSLAWRTVITDLETFRTSYPRLAQFADEALEFWRSYLCGETKTPGHYEHHMFFHGEISGTEGANRPPNINEYISLTVDHAIAYSSESIFAYTKLPGIAFWSTIYPIEATGWMNTQILERGTMQDKQVAPHLFSDFIQGRIKLLTTSRANMSERERERIRQAILSNLDGVANSKVFQILLADRNDRYSG